MIELNGVTKLYKSVIGVNEICLALPRGAHGLLGPNGSGKSTLINLITGQLRPTIGRVQVFGQRPWNNRGVLRRIGLCPEQDVLYPNVTGLEWVSYLLELYGFGRSEARRRAEEALERVGLAPAMHRKVGEYSRGMRQRAKLAQAIAHEPELLILDEPFNGLDPVGRHALTELLREWVHLGRSVLLASHILYEVEAITHSFLLIYGSRLLAVGSADEMQEVLADLSSEIRIRTNDPRRLAQRLVEQGAVESVRLGDDPQSLVVSTRKPAMLYGRMAEWLDSSGIEIYELRSADDSLQSLFSSLVRIRRGML